MRRRDFVAAGLLALSGGAALAQSVTFDFDRAADFSRVRTYAWVRGTEIEDPLNHKRIVAAVDAQLARKGLVRVEEGADVLVAYHASFDKDLRITSIASGWAGYRFGGTRSGSARVEEIVKGTLAVDVVDARTGNIVWRGMATKDVALKVDPEKREKSINKAAEKLLKSFPPAE